MAPAGPFKLCTVNNAPERAQRLVGRVIADMKDEYTIIHAGNAERESKTLHIKSSVLTTHGRSRPKQSLVRRAPS
jgi:hypothetical protein